MRRQNTPMPVYKTFAQNTRAMLGDRTPKHGFFKQSLGPAGQRASAKGHSLFLHAHRVLSRAPAPQSRPLRRARHFLYADNRLQKGGQAGPVTDSRPQGISITQLFDLSMLRVFYSQDILHERPMGHGNNGTITLVPVQNSHNPFLHLAYRFPTALCPFWVTAVMFR